MNVQGVNLDDFFKTYFAAEQKRQDLPPKLSPKQTLARVNDPIAAVQRPLIGTATLFGWSAQQLQSSIMAKALERMRASRKDPVARNNDARNLSDKELDAAPGHVESMETMVCAVPESCGTIYLKEYQNLIPDRPGTKSYIDTRVFEATAHHLAFGPNIALGDRAYFMDEGTQKLLMNDTSTNRQLLRSVQVVTTKPTRACAMFCFPLPTLTLVSQPFLAPWPNHNPGELPPDARHCNRPKARRRLRRWHRRPPVPLQRDPSLRCLGDPAIQPGCEARRRGHG